jgi:hypothetical protein
VIATSSNIVEHEQSGYADVLREQPALSFPSHQYTELHAVEVSVSELIDFESARRRGIWQFLYLLDETRYGWLDDALSKIAILSTDSDRVYADLALRQASHVSQKEPRIYNAPGGGVVIESRTKDGILTLLIEDRIGLIVRSADDFRVNAEFNIGPHSINQLLARYVGELRLLFLSHGD